MTISNGQLLAAIHALNGVLPLTAPADFALSRFFRENHELGPRERAFVAETVFGVLRHRRVLEALSPRAVPRELVLIEIAKYHSLSLRDMAPLLRKGEDVWLAAAKAEDVTQLPPAVQLNLPDWLYDMLVAQWGEAQTREFAQAMDQPAPLDVRANTLKLSRDALVTELQAAGLAAAPTRYSKVGVRLEGKPALNKHPRFIDGSMEVQDEGSQLLCLLMEPKRHDMIVDFCAGAGGKTLALGALMNSQGRLYAFDVSEKRLNNLKPRLKRSGLSNVQPVLLESENDIRVKRLAGKIDRVLVDAPCSGLGTLRRNPDLKWRQQPKDVDELTVKQQAILVAAARLLKPGGRLVYATCSVLARENEAIVNAFLQTHPEFSFVPAADVLSRIGLGIACGDYFRLAPQTHGTDGFFAAVMERAPKAVPAA